MRNSRIEKEIEEAFLKDNDLSSSTLSIIDYLLKDVKIILGYGKPDFIINHLDLSSFKIASRTWLGILVTTIFMSITPILKYCGPAAYLMIIVSCIENAGGWSLAHCFYTSFLDLSFVVFAFTCNVAGNAINWAIRGYPTTSKLMTELSELGICSLEDSSCLLHQIHTGRYLTTKTTIVTIIFMMISLTICGYAQQRSLYVVSPWILSAICTITTGVTLNQAPVFTPWPYGKDIIIPMCISFAVRMVLSIAYLPNTSNYRFFSTVILGMKDIQRSMGLIMNDLQQINPSDKEYVSKVKSSQTQLTVAMKKLSSLEREGLISRGEFAYSRLNPADLYEFQSLTRTFATSISGFQFFFDKFIEKRFHILDGHENDFPCKICPFPKETTVESKIKSPMQNQTSLDPNLSTNDTRSYTKHSRKSSSTTIRSSTSINVESLWGLSKIHSKEKQQDKRSHPSNTFEDNIFKMCDLECDGMQPENFDQLYHQIMDHYSKLSSSLQTLLSVIIEWSDEANKFRCWSFFSPINRRERLKRAKVRADDLVNALNHTNHAFKYCQDAEYNQIWLENICKTNTFRSRENYMYVLAMDSFYGCSMERMAKYLQNMAIYCIILDKVQPKPHWIYPFMKNEPKTSHFEAGYVTTVKSADNVYHRMPFRNPGSSLRSRNPDSGPPSTAFHLLGVQIQNFWHSTCKSRIQFCIKRSLFTILACITCLIRETCLWSYSNRIVWVPIMTALTVSTQAGDGVYGFLLKMMFTFIGSLSGMVIWYIGNGRSNGNAYGFVAAMGVGTLIFSYFRHFHKLSVPMGAVVLCVTTVLVTGMSWVNCKLKPEDVSLGRGFRVAWIRFAAVSVGLFVSFIGTMFPKPVTAKKQVRTILGESIESLGDIQVSISNFIVQRYNDQRIHILPRQDIIIKKLRSFKLAILKSRKLAERIRYEPPLGGKWPRHRFLLLMDLMWEAGIMLEDIYFFSNSITSSNQMSACLEMMGWSSATLTCTLYLVLILSSRSLRSGNALPSLIPERLSEIYSQQLKEIMEFNNDSRSSDNIERLLEHLFTDHDGRLVLAMIITTSAFYQRVDGSIRLIQGLVGEIYGLDHCTYNYSEEDVPLIWQNFKGRM